MAENFLITRCPACATAFRATEAQLAVRGGQVRCGRCEAIFDARAHALPGDAVTGESRQSGSAPPDDAQDASGEPEGNEIPAAVEPEQDAPAPEAETLFLLPPPSEAPPDEIEAESLPPAPDDAANPNLEFDFGRPKRMAGTGLRLFLFTAAGLLLIVLLLQLTFHFRGDLALLFPATRSTLEAACARLGCKLPLPQRADMMSIESSDLQADTLNPGIMVLSATLRNRAPFEQTPPALELTLTDVQDQPLARRVLTATDYLPGGDTAAAEAQQAFPPGSELPVKIYFDASAVQPTGYRLYLFYP